MAPAQPSAPQRSAVARPMPRLAPVMRTFRMVEVPPPAIESNRTDRRPRITCHTSHSWFAPGLRSRIKLVEAGGSHMTIASRYLLIGTLAILVADQIACASD